MKFLSLDLLAYGHFSKRSLAFPSSGPNFHIIYGPNEAGKSTALRAVTAFLYGIERSGVDAHRFESGELRVGAEVLHSDGRRRYLVRRRSGAGSLTDGDGRALDESQLHDWLSVRDRKLFEAMFGLSHVQLRTAGDALASSKNAAAEALFGAALEGSTLRATLERLQKEAEALLSPAGRAGEVVTAMRGYHELHDAERKARASMSKWTQLQEEIKKTDEAVRALDGQLAEARVEVGRLERVGRSLPGLQQRAAAIEARLALGDGPVLDARVGERRRELAHEMDEARVAADEIASKLERARRDRDALDAPAALVAFAPRVKALNEAVGTYRKALVDRPGLVQGILPLRRDAEEILRELGRPGMSLEDAESLRVLAPEQERIRALQRRGVEARARLAELRQQVADVEAELARCGALIAGLAPPRNVAVLQAVWASFAAEHDLDRSIREAADAWARERADLAANASALGVGPGEVSGVVRAPVPAEDVIRAAEREEDGAAKRRAALSEKLRDATDARSDARRALDALALGESTPTIEALHDARGRRDDLWEQARRAWTAGALASDSAGGRGGDVSWEEAVSSAIRRADAVVDALLGDAERVSRRAELQRAWEACDGRVREVERQVEEHARAEATRVAAWRERWAATGVEPGTARAMMTWRARWEALAAAANRCEAAAGRCEHLRERAGELGRALAAALDAVGVRCHPDVPWPALRALVEGTLAEAAGAEQRGAAARGEEARVVARVERARGQRTQAEQALASWRAEWAEATEKVWPRGDLEPDAAPHLFSRLDRLFHTISERERLEKRVAAIDKDIARFERDLDERLAQAGVALEGPPIDRATVLIDRVEAAVRASQRRADLDEQIERLELELGAARGRHERADLGLRRLLEEAGCESAEALEEMERRSAAIRAFEEDRVAAERRLLENGEGQSLAELIAAAEGMDGDRVRGRLVAVAADIAQKEEARAAAQTHLGDLKGQRRLFSAGDEAANQLQAARSQGEKARALAERCARLHVARAVLQRAMARYQEESRTAVLSRAEALFARLTRGRYTGLTIDFGGEVATLRCRRGGEEVRIKEKVMSDGTLDQLYLALRLASLEQHLVSQEPMPMVLDDIFIHFDDERAQAGIEVLAEFAEKTQVLLLTHHRRNLELARRALPEGRWGELHLEPSAGT